MGNSSTKAKNIYNAKAYDQVGVMIPKGKKDEWKAFAEGQSMSLSAMIQQAVKEYMEKITQ